MTSYRYCLHLSIAIIPWNSFLIETCDFQKHVARCNNYWSINQEEIKSKERNLKLKISRNILKNGLSLRESRERNDIQRGKEFQCCVANDPLAGVLLKKDIIDSPIRMIQLIHLNESQERETELWNILIWRRFSCSPSLRLEEPRSLHLPQRTPQLVKWTEEGLRLID